MTERKCVYVVGAGFSAGLGFPLTGDLLARLWERISRPFRRELRRVIEFYHPAFNPELFTSFPNVEQFLSEMRANEDLFDASSSHQGRFTREELHEVQRKFLMEIVRWFHELAEPINPNEPHPEWLKAFRDRVKRDNAAIISFNWDLVLDKLFFANSLGAESYGFGPNSSHGPILLKPHGSLNWFEQKLGSHLKEPRRVLIFDRKCNKNAIYAFNRFREPHSKSDRSYTPLIVPPIYLKSFKEPVFETLWKNCTSTLSSAKKIVYLGYSMPQADLHAQLIMRFGYHNQEDGKFGTSGVSGSDSGAAEVVIVNPDLEAARRIAAIVGPGHKCRWISKPIADCFSGRVPW